MDVLNDGHIIDLDSPLSKVSRIFKETEFAFLPIVNKTNYKNLNSYKMLAYLSVRGFLPFFLKRKEKKDRYFDIDNFCLKEIIDMPVKEVSSKLISVYKNSLRTDVYKSYVK